MLRYDEKTGRIIQRVVGMRGMNTLAPRRALQEGEATYTSNVRVRSGKVVPGKVSTDVEAFASFAPTQVIYYMFEAQFDPPELVILGTTKAWIQSAGNPVERTPSVAFTGGATALWHGYTMMTEGFPIVVVNNSGVDVPHYYDPAQRTLAYETGDDGTGDIPDVGDTVTGAAGSVGIITAITKDSGEWVDGDAAGTLTLKQCSGDWADEEVLTFEDGETAAAAAASALRPFLPLTNAPNMRCMIGWLGCLFGGNVLPGNNWLHNRIQWSDYQDITAYSGATSGFYDLDDEGDPIKRFGLFRGNIMPILRRESIYIAMPTGDPGDPIACQPFAKRGIAAPNSLQMLEEEYLFLGDDDIYMLSTRALERVGGRVRTDLFRDIDESNLQYAWSFLDRRTKEYYLITTMQDATQRAWIFNYEDGQWATQLFTGYTSLVTWRADA